jgi:hypothetical protein
MNVLSPRVLLPLALLAAFTVPAPTGFADEASGTFRFDKTTFHPIDAVAYRQPGKDPSKPVTLITLADFKIDRQNLIDSIDTANALANQALQQAAKKQGGNVVTVTLLPADRCDLTGFLGEGQQELSLIQFKSKTASSSPDRVSGECVTPELQHFAEKTYEFRLKYDVPFMTIPKPTTLPAGGGEPGQAFSALVVAIESADWNGAHNRLQEQEVPSDPPKGAELKKYFKTIGRNYPKKAVVTGGLTKGPNAVLTITGTDQDGAAIHGDVMMKKTATGWRVKDLTLYTNG